MFCILLLASLFPVPSAYTRHFTVAAVFSQKSANLEDSLKKAEVEISQRNILPNGTTLDIQTYLLKNFSITFNSSLTSFCDVITTGNIRMAIIANDMGKNTWIIPWVSSVLRIPVSLAYKSSIGEQKGDFSTVFSMVPSVSEVSKAVAELAQYFGWRDLAILTGKGRESTKITRKLLESMRSGDAMRTKVSFHRQFNPRDHNDVNNVMQTLGVLDVRAVFLHCDSSEVKSIFSAAKKNGLFASGRVWIVTEAVIEGCSAEASNCPPGLIGLRLRRSREPGKDQEADVMQDLVRDSVMVYADALRRLLKNEKFPRLPLSLCKSKPLNGSDKLFKLALDTSIQGKTGLIKFDNKGNRVEPEYEIVSMNASKNGTVEWVSMAFWVDGALKSENTKFQWPVGIRFPPVGMVHKKVLRVVSVVIKPYLYYSSTRERGRNGAAFCGKGSPCKVYPRNTKIMTPTYYCCEGLVIDLLKMLEIDVGFQSDVHIVKDGKYGAKDAKTGEWNGMIGELLRGEADVAIGDLTITELRSRVVEFSHPFLSAGLGVLVSARKSTAHSWLFRFLEPYSWELWVAGVISVNIVIVILWITDRFSPLGYYRRSLTVKEKKKFNVESSLWFTWGAVFHVDEAKVSPKSFSARVITVCFAFAMTILTTTYTANLAAVLVSEYEDFPVSKDGIRDPKFQNPPKNFKFGTRTNSVPKRQFKESSNPAHNEIWKNMRDVDTFSGGVEKVLSGEWDVFIYDEPTLLYAASQQETCHLRLVGPTVFQSGFGLAFPKNSTFTLKISNALLLYEQRDILHKLNTFWLSGKCGEREQRTVSSFTAMSVEDMSGVFTFVIIAIGVTLILLFVEFKVAKHGFPLSRIWMNHPNWKAGTTFSPAASSNGKLTTSSPEILEFCQQKFDNVDFQTLANAI